MKNIRNLIITLAITLIAALNLTGCGAGTQQTDLSPYMSLSFSGVNGEGTAKANFDYAAFEGDIMKEWKADDYTEKLMKLTELESSFKEDCSSSSGLSNGDEVTMTISFDEAKAKEYGYSFSGTSLSFKAEGLVEPIVVDPFDAAYFGTESGVKLNFEGTAPFASLNIENNCAESDPIHTVTYQADMDSGLKNGDTVTITASLPESATAEGYVLSSTESSVTVSGLNSYITDVSMLSAADRRKLNSKLKDYFISKCSDYVDINDKEGNSNSFSAEDIGSIGELAFSDTGYTAIETAWDETVTTIVPFTVDVEKIKTYWIGTEYFEGGTELNFPSASGYFTVGDLIVDESGTVVNEGAISVSMSSLYETEAGMLTELKADNASGGLTEGSFAE